MTTSHLVSCNRLDTSARFLNKLRKLITMVFKPLNFVFLNLEFGVDVEMGIGSLTKDECKDSNELEQFKLESDWLKSEDEKLGRPHLQQSQETFWRLLKIAVFIFKHLWWNQTSQLSQATEGCFEVQGLVQMPHGKRVCFCFEMGPGFSSMLPDNIKRIFK